MDKQVAAHIQSLSNLDLWMMLNSEPDSYTPEAMDFAHSEWNRREVTPEEKLKILEEQGKTDREQETMKSREDKPLSWLFRVLVVLFWYTIFLPIFLSAIYFRAGRKRASEQVWGCVGIGIGISVVLWLASWARQ
jgi:hypothetical protein